LYQSVFVIVLHQNHVDKDRVKSRLSVHQAALRRQNCISPELLLSYTMLIESSESLPSFFPTAKIYFSYISLESTATFVKIPFSLYHPNPSAAWGSSQSYLLSL